MYLHLVARVRGHTTIGADYMLSEDARKLPHFYKHHKLIRCFNYSDTPQGWGWWDLMQSRVEDDYRTLFSILCKEVYSISPPLPAPLTNPLAIVQDLTEPGAEQTKPANYDLKRDLKKFLRGG